MTAQTVKKVMQQRLTRGTPVVIADSFGKAKLRGAHKIIASKGPVKCNKGGRCAGNWCAGLAVFVGDPETLKEDKGMGWRVGKDKVCLTHLKDESGALILAPPTFHPTRSRLPEAEPETPGANGNGSTLTVVTWEELARAHQDGDIDRLALMARKLKTDNERLKGKVIVAQDKLIEHLSAR